LLNGKPSNPTCISQLDYTVFTASAQAIIKAQTNINPKKGLCPHILLSFAMQQYIRKKANQQGTQNC
jgi:hypothetical protein